MLAFHLPGLEVELLGEPSRGLFVFYSAAVPVALLMLTSWLEEGGPVSELLSTGATIGAGEATAIRLAIELFASAPVITYPFFGTLFEDSLADERGWLAINALLAAIAAIAPSPAPATTPRRLRLTATGALVSSVLPRCRGRFRISIMLAPTPRHNNNCS